MKNYKIAIAMLTAIGTKIGAVVLTIVFLMSCNQATTISPNACIMAAGAYPQENDGSMHLQLSNYNPTNGSNPPSFYGSELISNQVFIPTAGTILDITVHAKLDVPSPGGYVGTLFLYPATLPSAANNYIDNEVDFEILSNNVANGSNMVQTNVYANQSLGAGNAIMVNLPSGTLTDYHAYEIVLNPGISVTWKIDGITVRTDSVHVPNEQMRFYINAWVPTSNWTQAYNAGIQPVTNDSACQAWYMDVNNLTISANGTNLLSDSFSGTSVNTQIWSLPVWSTNGSTFIGRTQLVTQ